MQRIGRARVRRAIVMAAAAVVVAGLVVAASGCGGDDGSGGSGGAPAAGSGAPAQSAELAACLEENGITLGSGMPDQDSLERIRQACGDVMPRGGPGAGGGAPGGVDPSAIADCLREAGIDVPDGDDPGALMGAIDPSDPDVTAALQACGVGTPGS